MPTAWVSAVRVDTLRVGAYADMSPEFARSHEWRRRQLTRKRVAGLDDVFTVDGAVVETLPGAYPYAVGYACAEWAAMVATGVTDGLEASTPCVLITFRARYLSATTLAEVKAKAERIVSELTGTARLHRWVLSRLDLCRDVASDDVKASWLERLQFVTRAVNRSDHAVDPELERQLYAVGLDTAGVDPRALAWKQELRRYCAGTTFSGYTIGSRGAESVMLRFYAKALQARLKGLEWWQDLVRSEGCPEAYLRGRGRLNVWRAEFELGRGPLKEFLPEGLCEFSRLVDDEWRARVWRYLTNHWCRVVEDDANAPGIDELHETGGRRRVKGATRPEDRATLQVWRAVHSGAAAVEVLEGAPTGASAAVGGGQAAARQRRETQLVPAERLRKQAAGVLAAYLLRTGATNAGLNDALDLVVADSVDAFARQQHKRVDAVATLDARDELTAAVRLNRTRGDSRALRPLVDWLGRAVEARDARASGSASDAAPDKERFLHLLRGQVTEPGWTRAPRADVRRAGVHHGPAPVRATGPAEPQAPRSDVAADALRETHRRSVGLLEGLEALTAAEQRAFLADQHSRHGRGVVLWDGVDRGAQVRRIAARAAGRDGWLQRRAELLDGAAHVLACEGQPFAASLARRNLDDLSEWRYRAKQRADFWCWLAVQTEVKGEVQTQEAVNGNEESQVEASAVCPF